MHIFNVWDWAVMCKMLSNNTGESRTSPLNILAFPSFFMFDPKALMLETFFSAIEHKSRVFRSEQSLCTSLALLLLTDIGLCCLVVEALEEDLSKDYSSQPSTPLAVFFPDPSTKYCSHYTTSSKTQLTSTHPSPMLTWLISLQRANVIDFCLFSSHSVAWHCTA